MHAPEKNSAALPFYYNLNPQKKEKNGILRGPFWMRQRLLFLHCLE